MDNIGENVVWQPQSGPQEMLVNCPITLIGYGGARGGGKGLNLLEILPTTGGWKTMGEVAVGDYLFNSAGEPVQVIYKSEPQLRQCFKLTFDNGQTIIADDVHRWRTHTKAERVSNFKLTDEFRAKRRASRPSRAKANSTKPWGQSTLAKRNSERVYHYKEPNNGSMRDTLEIYNTLRVQDGREVNHAIKLCGAVKRPHANLSVSPYVLGVWLGNGSKNSGYIAIGNHDAEEMIRTLSEEGYQVWPLASELCYKISKSGISFRSELMGLGVLNNKHIPKEYLNASIEQRLALLQGLMDTDGCCNKDGQVEFCNTNYDIASGVCELLASLGAKPFMTSRIPICGNSPDGPKACARAWYVKATTALPAFRNKRKAERLPTKLRETQNWHYIVNVEPVESVWTQCLTVNCPTHEFLVSKSYIPTMNTDGVLGKIAIDQERYGADFNAIFFRKELPQADDLIERAKQIYLPLQAHWQEQKKQFTFPNGARLRFRPLGDDSDAEKYQGQNINLACVEEAGNFADPSPIWKLFGALRGKGGGQVILTFNPGGIGHHWLKALFIKPEPKGKKVLHKQLPNGALFDYIYIPSRVGDNQILLARDPEYINRLHMVGSPELVRAWLEGDWEIHEGSFFPEFSSRHIIAPFNVPKHWHRYLGYDWGYRSPFAAVWGAVCSGKTDDGKEVPYPKGSIIIYREMWGKGVDNGEQATRIATASLGENVHAAADPSIFNNQGGPSIADQFNAVFAKYKHPSFRHADNDRQSGWAQIRQRLVAKPPLLYITTNCPYLLETLPALAIDKRHPEDADSSGNDHACFVGDTLVQTELGVRPIKDICSSLVAKVLSHDGQFHDAWGALTKRNAEVLRLTFDDGSSVTCTPSHQIMLADGRWQEASCLNVGEPIRCVTAGTDVRTSKAIKSISHTEAPQDVYCLIVPDTDTFVLDNGIVVHNCDALRYLCKERLIDSKWEEPKPVFSNGLIQLQAYVNRVRKEASRPRI